MDDKWEQYAVKDEKSNIPNGDKWEQYAVSEEIPNPEKPRKRSIFNPGDFLEMLSENPLNPRQQIKAIPQVAEDIKNKTYKAGDWLRDLPNKLKESYALGKRDPSKAFRAETAGIPDTAYSLLNIPGSVVNYAEKVGLLPKELNVLTKYLNTPDMSKAVGDTVGLTGEKGEELFRGLVPGAANILGGVKSAIPLAKGVFQIPKQISTKVLGKENPILQAQKLQKEIALGNKENLLEKAKDQYQSNKELYGEAKAQAEQEGIGTSHNKLVNELNVHDEKINQANIKSQELQEKLNKLKEEAHKEPEKFQEREIVPPEKKEFIAPEKPYEHEERAKKADEEYTAAEDNLSQVKENHEQIKKLSEDASERIGEHLNLGSAHHVHVGEYIRDQFNKLHEKLKEDYTAKVKVIKDEKIKVPTENIYNPANHKNEFVKDVLKELPKKREVSAATVMTRFKDLKSKIYELEQRRKKAETARERDIISESLPILRKVQDSFQRVLDKSLGSHASDFKSLNKRYTDFYKLKENTSRRMASKKGKLSKSMIDQLSGSEIGQDLLRNLVSKNHEMVKHIVGQRFKSKPDLIHKPDELTGYWTKQLPEVRKLAGQKIKADEMVKQSERQIEESTKQRNIAKKNSVRSNNEAIRARNEYKEKLREHKSQVREQTEKEKSYQKELSNHETEREENRKLFEQHEGLSKKNDEKIKKVEKSIDSNTKELNKLKNDKEKIIKNMNNLKEKFNVANISLQEKNKLGREIYKLKKEIIQLDSNIDKSTTGILFYMKKAHTFYKAAKRISRGF